MLTKKIPFYTVIVSAILGAALSFAIYSFAGERSSNDRKNEPQLKAPVITDNCGYSIARLAGYHFIRPLMLADQNCESGKYAPIKAGLDNLIENYKSAGTITSASVYLRDFNQGEGIFINDQEKYDPGSLMKVPLMITFLKMAEDNPALLNKEILYSTPFSSIRTATFLSQTIQVGHKYTIRQLLHAITAYSDNEAASLLCQNVDGAQFKRTFSDLGLPEIDITATKYPMDARDFSVFMEALFNAGYLTIHDSEYATSLLAQCDFKQGILSGLPETMIVAHKFGEGGDVHTPELHESAIIYYKNSPYLLTIMTRGKDLKQLTTVLSGMSKLVYDNMAQASL